MSFLPNSGVQGVVDVLFMRHFRILVVFIAVRIERPLGQHIGSVTCWIELNGGRRSGDGERRGERWRSCLLCFGARLGGLPRSRRGFRGSCRGCSRTARF